jgi:hyaluronoglucosaminidase
LEKLRDDIGKYIPDPNFNGLGVIDFEEWRPLWDTNYDSKKIYQEHSIRHVQNRNPDLDAVEAERIAIDEFNLAAR